MIENFDKCALSAKMHHIIKHIIIFNIISIENVDNYEDLNKKIRFRLINKIEKAEKRKQKSNIKEEKYIVTYLSYFI